MRKSVLENYNTFYLSGICGVSMSAIAKHLVNLGKTVSGSDKELGSVAKELKKLGVKVYKGNKAEHLQKNPPQVLVYTSAIREDSQELLYAKEQGITIIKRSELLGEILSTYPISIGVSGSHGKTTATAMIAKVLENPSHSLAVFLGGNDSEFGNYKFGDKMVVAEACEYKKNFLDLKPTYSVVLNLDNDHMECYKDQEDLVNTFREFAKNTISVINADDKCYERLTLETSITFGINNLATYMAKNLKQNEKGYYSFDLYVYGKKKGRIDLNVQGKHNVYNALCACVFANLFGVSFKQTQKGLKEFKGVERRMETLCEKGGVKYITDYAHHPQEISAFIYDIKRQLDTTQVIFQPHTYSRTKNLMQDFIRVFEEVNNLCLYKTYPAREKYQKQASAKALCDNINNEKERAKTALYLDNEKQLCEFLQSIDKQIKTVVFLGAGDIYQKAKKILKIK